MLHTSQKKSNTIEIAILAREPSQRVELELAAIRNAHASALAPMPAGRSSRSIFPPRECVGSDHGEVTSEDVIEAIFRDFVRGRCVTTGKN